jgi:hypothetical protein
MINAENVDPGTLGRWVPRGPSPPPPAPCMTEAQAITKARQRLCALGWPDCPGTDAQVKAKVLSDHTLFTGTTAGNEDISIRCALGDPLAGQDCQDCGGGGGGDNTVLLLGLMGLVAVGAFIVAQSGKKKVLIARVPGG